jgi:uncharacterized protein with FMN-binding domain
MFPKRGAIALVTTALALVLLISFKMPDQPTSPAGSDAGSSTTDTSSNSTTTGNGAGASSSSSSSSSGSTATATPAPTAASGTVTVTGSVVSTRYGDVEVKVTVSNGKISDVQAIELPSGGRSGQISNYVAPILASEALKAQNASIDIVSGATYTSQAYARSLQSALDQAAANGAAING